MTDDVKSTKFSRPNAKSKVEDVLPKPTTPPMAAMIVHMRLIHESQNAALFVCLIIYSRQCKTI